MSFFFFFNDTATTEIYTLSLHDALPICIEMPEDRLAAGKSEHGTLTLAASHQRSEEHTSELQSPCNLVCRLLLEKKKKLKTPPNNRRPTFLCHVRHIHLDRYLCNHLLCI